MNRRFLSALVVTTVLLAPGLGHAVAAAQERADAKVGPVTVRVYDRSHKDYHDWTPNEDRAYRTYSQHQSSDLPPAIAKASE